MPGETMDYQVKLFLYRRGSNTATCLTPVVRDEVGADTFLDALYLVMERHSYSFVDGVEVRLPDGSLFRWSNVLCRNTYDVALWRKDRVSEIPLCGDRVKADSPLLAALSLMQENGLTYVARVVVRCPGGFTWRMDRVKREREEVIL